MADWLLYEHDDGRHAVAPSAEAATFAHGDPAWHRVGPVEVSSETRDDISPTLEALPIALHFLAPSEEQVLAAVREVGGLVYDNGAISFMRAEHFLAAVAALGVGVLAEAPSGGVTWTPEDEKRLDEALAKRAAARAALGGPPRSGGDAASMPRDVALQRLDLRTEGDGLFPSSQVQNQLAHEGAQFGVGEVGVVVPEHNVQDSQAKLNVHGGHGTPDGTGIPQPGEEKKHG